VVWGFLFGVKTNRKENTMKVYVGLFDDPNVGVTTIEVSQNFNDLQYRNYITAVVVDNDVDLDDDELYDPHIFVHEVFSDETNIEGLFVRVVGKHTSLANIFEPELEIVRRKPGDDTTQLFDLPAGWKLWFPIHGGKICTQFFNEEEDQSVLYIPIK
jgi:hypothetical protein